MCLPVYKLQKEEETVLNNTKKLEEQFHVKH